MDAQITPKQKFWLATAGVLVVAFGLKAAIDVGVVLRFANDVKTTNSFENDDTWIRTTTWDGGHDITTIDFDRQLACKSRSDEPERCQSFKEMDFISRQNNPDDIVPSEHARMDACVAANEMSASGFRRKYCGPH